MALVGLLAVVFGLAGCGGGGGGGGDAVAPAAATSFVARPSAGGVLLRWTPPTDPDYSGVLIRRASDTYPTSFSSGTWVYTGGGDTTVDSVGASVGTTLYYTLFTYDSSRNFGPPAYASTASSTTFGVSDFVATLDTGGIRLDWSIAGTPAYMWIRRSETDYPLNETAGLAVLAAPGGSIPFTVTDPNPIGTDAMYYYSAFLLDGFGEVWGPYVTSVYVSLPSLASHAVGLATEGNGDSRQCNISPTGRYVTFQSAATNLVSGDTNAVQDVFVYDRTTNVIKVGSLCACPNETMIQPAANGDISSNGTVLAFETTADNMLTLPAQDYTLGANKVFRSVLSASGGERTLLVSRTNSFTGIVPAYADSWDPSISDNGQFVVFTSNISNLTDDPAHACDTNGFEDVFVFDANKAYGKESIIVFCNLMCSRRYPPGDG